MTRMLDWVCFLVLDIGTPLVFDDFAVETVLILQRY
jgi:hypothetical protein